ncbi:MAG: TIGR03084 family metal-binding protein [Nocardioides sp.]
MSLLDELLADLEAESDALRAVVAELSEEQWRAATPAEGWDVATSIAHLAWTDEAAVAAAAAAAGDKESWDALVLEALADMNGVVDKAALAGGAVAPAELLARWDTARPALAEALRGTDAAGLKLPWFGPPMSAASMATARFMETWAHGLDVRDAVGVPAERTDRVKHVCHLAVRTRGYAYSVHSLDVPEAEVRVELASPGGETWTWGPQDAAQSVKGSAWDFAQLATKRIHRDDTDLVATGPDADEWLDIVQAFAGPSGKGRDRA